MLMVDRRSSGDQGDGHSRTSEMSATGGRMVLITSHSQLIGGDDNALSGIYRRGPLY